MTVSRAEFLRILAGAVGDFDRRDGAADTVLTERSGPRQWRMRLSELAPLRLGALTMERLEVELSFEGYGEEAEEAFIAGFLRHAQRGGG